MRSLSLVATDATPGSSSPLSRIDLLILNNWGLQVLTQAQRIDLLEILEDRNGRGSTPITSQVPID